MPGKPRMYLPGVPCHVIQLSNNRDATFFAEQDYQFYPGCLYDAVISFVTDPFFTFYQILCIMTDECK